MKRRLYDSVQVWGPGAIAIVSLLASISYGLGQERKIGRLEGRVYSLERLQDREQNIELGRRQEIATLQAYIASLEKAILRSGIDLPDKSSQHKEK